MDDSTFRLIGLILALVGVVLFVVGMVRRAIEPGVEAPRDAIFIAAGSALALVGIGLRVWAAP